MVFSVFSVMCGGSMATAMNQFRVLAECSLGCVGFCVE